MAIRYNSSSSTLNTDISQNNKQNHFTSWTTYLIIGALLIIIILFYYFYRIGKKEEDKGLYNTEKIDSRDPDYKNNPHPIINSNTVPPEKVIYRYNISEKQIREALLQAHFLQLGTDQNTLLQKPDATLRRKDTYEGVPSELNYLCS